MNSMTGYGRCQIEIDGREMTVELKSVNHRFLDISYRLAKHLSFLEEFVRKEVSTRLSRGHIEISINYVNHRDDAKEIYIDTGIITAYRQAIKRVSEITGCSPDQMTIKEYMSLPDIIQIHEKEEDYSAVHELFQQAMSKALNHLIEMREREGKAMADDIGKRIKVIEQIREQMKDRAPNVINEYRDKLRQRIKAMTEGEIDEARLITEVAIFADRAAIDEELVRIDSHCIQIMETISLTEPIGRKLDFLVQELNREFNTIGSKASDAAIASMVVKAKGEIEKLREQVQNIE